MKIKLVPTNSMLGALEYWSDGVLEMKGKLLLIQFWYLTVLHYSNTLIIQRSVRVIGS
jgi:hypothetical protein